MSINLILYAISLFSILVYYILNIRDVIYLIPLMSFVSLALNPQLKFQIATKSLANLFGLLLVFTFIGLLINYKVLNVYSVKQSLFTMFGVFSALVLLNGVSKKNAIQLLRYFVIIMLIRELAKNPTALIKMITNPLGFLINSEADSESIASFIYGGLFLSFLIIKDKTYTALTFILMLYGGKRIVILAVILSVVASFIYFRKNKQRPLLIPIVFVSISLLYIGGVILLVSGFFDEYVIKYFGVSVNFLLKGRVYNYTTVIDYLGGFSILGSGPGLTTYLLKSGTLDSNAGLLHSDILRIYLEYGFFMSIVIFAAIGKIASFNKVYFSVIIYLFTLLFSDNVFIYLEVVYMNFLFAILFGEYYEEN